MVYLVWRCDQVDGLHAGQRLTLLCNVFYNCTTEKHFHLYLVNMGSFLSLSIVSGSDAKSQCPYINVKKTHTLLMQNKDWVELCVTGIWRISYCCSWQCFVFVLTGDSLRHDVCHLTAGGHHPHAQFVHNKHLKHITMCCTFVLLARLYCPREFPCDREDLNDSTLTFHFPFSLAFLMTLFIISAKKQKNSVRHRYNEKLSDWIIVNWYQFPECRCVSINQ